MGATAGLVNAPPHTNNGAESYHSHLNAEFYPKRPNIYIFVTSKFEREKRQFMVTAYFDYRRQVLTRKEFLKKVCYR